MAETKLGSWFYEFKIRGESRVIEAAPGMTGQPEPAPYRSRVRRIGRGKTFLAAVRNSKHAYFVSSRFWESAARINLYPTDLNDTRFFPE